MSDTLNDIKVYFGFVKSVNDEARVFRAQVSIPGKTDQSDETGLPWYFPWYGINYLPKEGDEVAVIIFDNNLSTGFYTPKLDIQQREISEEDYPTYLELYKNNEDKIKLVYQKSKGVLFNNDKSVLNLQKDKSVLQTDKSNITLTENDMNLIVESVQLKLEKGGFTLKKENETLKKILEDLLTEIEMMKFKTNNGMTIKLINKAKFTQIKNRIKKFFVS